MTRSAPGSAASGTGLRGQYQAFVESDDEEDSQADTLYSDNFHRGGSNTPTATTLSQGNNTPAPASENGGAESGQGPASNSNSTTDNSGSGVPLYLRPYIKDGAHMERTDQPQWWELKLMRPKLGTLFDAEDDASASPKQANSFTRELSNSFKEFEMPQASYDPSSQDVVTVLCDATRNYARDWETTFTNKFNAKMASYGPSKPNYHLADRSHMRSLHEKYNAGELYQPLDYDGFVAATKKAWEGTKVLEHKTVNGSHLFQIEGEPKLDEALLLVYLDTVD